MKKWNPKFIAICVIAYRPETIINHLINPRIEFLNEANIYIKCTGLSDTSQNGVLTN